MATRLSTPERLELLLDWLNDDWDLPRRDWRRELPRRLLRFIASSDGSEEAGFVRAEVRADDRPAFLRPPGTEHLDEYEVLHTALIDLLQRGHPGSEPFLPDLIEIPLHYGSQRSAPLRPKGRERKRLARRPGAYVMRVAGEPFALVLWLVMHLLRLPRAVLLMRCDAPKPYSAERCGRFFVQGGLGRAPERCSEACRQRKFWERDRRDHKGRAAAKRRTRRRKQ